MPLVSVAPYEASRLDSSDIHYEEFRDLVRSQPRVHVPVFKDQPTHSYSIRNGLRVGVRGWVVYLDPARKGFLA